ncbi:MAG: Na/Pi symporter, partial [Lentisphaeria bacterium]|nr:Na/Pi symporter [Lentisphaeria bacterium]
MRLFISLTAVLLLLAGCGKNNASKVSDVKILGGNNQCVAAGKKLAEPLRIQLSGEGPKNIFGKKTSLPVAGAKVLFRLPSGAGKIKEITAITDPGGVAEAEITAPDNIGEHTVEIIPENNKNLKVAARLFSGIQISGGNREYIAGHTSEEPIKVRIAENGRGIAGVKVRFSMGSTVEGVSSSAVILSPEVITNASGEAETFVKLGKKTGNYQLTVTAVTPDNKVNFSNIKVQLQAVEPLSVAICVIGGLAFFLLGMCMMSDGIRMAAGENMRKVLSYFTSNRFSALLAGTFVTAIIQSSSATTVMVIGFINAGLLSLVQSMGIIFGANIGTTITAQIISFNLNGLALPSVAIGFFLTMTKKRNVNAWGTVLLGFGLIFFGMSMMSSELKLLGEMPSFRNFFSLFNCAPLNGASVMPINAVLGATLIGIIMTMVLQSSSAFTGIVLALAAGRLVDFYTAVPLLIGSNIGTTVTAQLGALNANRVAKQAALAHTLFNVLGAVAVILVCYIPYKGQPCFLYLVNSMTPGNAFAPVPQNLERHIAMFHTIFNVAVSLALIPFVSQFAAICQWIIPVRDKVKNKLLEPALLNTPTVALKVSATALEEMVIGAWDMVNRSVNEHFLTGDTDDKKYEELAEKESNIDQMQEDVTSYL